MESTLIIPVVTSVGSKDTRLQARAATPLQLWEMATVPTESGPGWTQKRNKHKM